MSRGLIAGPPGPPVAKVYTLDLKSRLRLNGEELEGLVPWLCGETVERVAVPGPRGGVIVVSPEAIADVLARLGPGDLQEDDAGSRRSDYARFLGMRWPLAFSFEPQAKRYTLTLPEGARQIGLLPGPEGKVVIFISGLIFEIWARDHWLENIKAQALTLSNIIEELG